MTAPKQIFDLLQVPKVAKSSWATYWAKEDETTFTDYEEWTITLSNDNQWKDPSETQLFWCDLDSLQTPPVGMITCNLYRFQWDDSLHSGEVTRYVFNSTTSRSGALDDTKSPLAQLLASQQDVKSELVQRWPSDKPVEQIVVKDDPTSDISIVQDETEPSYMGVRITVQRPLKWAESFEYFKPKERNQLTGLWVKIGSSAGAGNTFMEKVKYQPMNEDTARKALAKAAEEMEARKASAVSRLSSDIGVAFLALASTFMLSM